MAYNIEFKTKEVSSKVMLIRPSTKQRLARLKAEHPDTYSNDDVIRLLIDAYNSKYKVAF